MVWVGWLEQRDRHRKAAADDMQTIKKGLDRSIQSILIQSVLAMAGEPCKHFGLKERVSSLPTPSNDPAVKLVSNRR